MPYFLSARCAMYCVALLTLFSIFHFAAALDEPLCENAGESKDLEEDDDLSSLLQMDTSTIVVAKSSVGKGVQSSGIDDEQEENSMLQTLLQPSLDAGPSSGNALPDEHSVVAGRAPQRRKISSTADRGREALAQTARQEDARTSDLAENSVAPVFLQTGEEVGHTIPKVSDSHEGKTKKTQQARSPSSEPASSQQVAYSSDAAQSWDCWSRTAKLTVVFIQLVVVISWAIGRRIRSHLRTPGVVRENVQKLPVLPWGKIESLVTANQGASSVPKCMSAPHLCRLEVRIKGPADTTQEPLDAPLAQKDCVVFSVMVSAPKEDGGLAEAIAFKSKSIDFLASPLDSPEANIRICGSDVSLFDMCLGHTSGSTSLANAPTHWQNFVHTYKASHLSSNDTMLKFEECALLVGTIITVVGEPQRGDDGMISIVPRQAEYRDEVFVSNPVATVLSKGRAVTGPQMEAAAILEVLAAKVLASDDAQLLHFWMPLKRRFHACWKHWFHALKPKHAAEALLKNEPITGEISDSPSPGDSCLKAMSIQEAFAPHDKNAQVIDIEEGNVEGASTAKGVQERMESFSSMTPVPAG